MVQIAWCFYFDLKGDHFFLMASFMTILLAGFFLWNESYSGLVFCMSILFGTYASFYFQYNPLDKPLLAKKAIYQARVVQHHYGAQGVSWLDLDLVKRERPLKENLSGRVRLTVGDFCLLAKGSLVEFESKIGIVKSFRNPGVFDYRQFLNRQNIWAKGFVSQCSQVKVLFSSHLSLREQIRLSIFHMLKKSSQKDVFLALLLGERTLDFKRKRFLAKAGVSHLFAISGAHFAAMVFIVYGFMLVILNQFPFLFLLWPRQKWVAVGALGFVIFFVWIASSRSSIHRAGLMLSVYLLAQVFERKVNPLYLLFFSLSVHLVLNPLAIFQISFQMSYLCLLILVMVYRPLALGLYKRFKLRSFKMLIVQMLLLSWVLQVFLIPYTGYQFGSFHLIGLWNNLWAVPYFQFLVVPIGFLSFILHFLFPTLAGYLIFLWEDVLAVFYSGLSFFHSGGLSFYMPLFLMLCFYGLMIGCFLSPSVKRVGFSLLFFIFVYAGFFFYLQWDSYLRLTQIDVGQGDSFLIRSDKVVLIDGGGNPFLDIGDMVLGPYLVKQGLGSIDLLVITHDDYDHYGGFINLLDFVEIKQVWVGAFSRGDEKYRGLLSQFESSKIPVRKISREEFFFISSDTFLKVFPSKKLFTSNDRSLVLKLESPNGSALMTGDISKNQEKELVMRYGSDLKSNVLKVAHHGSLTSSSKLFLEKVLPDYALIGVGQNSHFGHPHPKVLKRLQESKVKVYRTDYHGAIDVWFTEKGIQVEPYSKRIDVFSTDGFPRVFSFKRFGGAI